MNPWQKANFARNIASFQIRFENMTRRIDMLLRRELGFRWELHVWAPGEEHPRIIDHDGLREQSKRVEVTSVDAVRHERNT